MSNILRLAIVDPNDSQRESLKSMFLGMDTIWLEAECSSYEFFADVVAQTKPDIGLVAIDADPQKAIELVARLASASPDCAVLVVSSSGDGTLILQALRAGAKEFLTQPLRIDDVLGVLGRIGEQRFGRGDDNRPRSSQVIAVAGANGGVGTTSLAVNLGCILAQDPQNSVALVDLDLCLGDADVFLDTFPDYTLVDMAQNVTRLDFTLLKRSLTKHSSGLYLLPRPVQLEDIALITPDDLQRVIGVVESHVHAPGARPVEGLHRHRPDRPEDGNHILLATLLDLPCLRNVVRLMMSFGNMDGLADKVKIVVNRVGLENGQITLKKAEETIGKEDLLAASQRLSHDDRGPQQRRAADRECARAAITQSLIALAKALSGDGTAHGRRCRSQEGLCQVVQALAEQEGRRSKLPQRWLVSQTDARINIRSDHHEW